MPYKSDRSSWARSSNRPTESRRTKLAAREISSTLFSKTGELKLGRKHRPDYILVILILALAFIGLIAMFSIAPAIASGSSNAQATFMWRQGIFLFIGLVTFFVVSRIPLDFWRRWGSWIFLLALVLCFALPILGMMNAPVVICTLGACRWYDLGFMSFQPAEFLKFGMVLFVSGFLAVRSAQNRLNSWSTLMSLGAVVLFSLFVIVIMQKDLGTGVALAAIVLIQLVIAGLSWRKLATILAAAVGLGVLSILAAPHRLERVATFLGGGTAETDYHINQAMIALGSGGWTGRGLGQSIQAFGWLPEAVNDSIFAILGETLGFIGLLAILLAFAYLLKRIIDKVDYTENAYLRLILAGVFGWLAAHVVLNVGAMTHLVPLTGITLPLVSFGGTSMLFMMAGLGVVFAISRYTTHRKVANEGKEAGDANSVRWRR
ncbi:putative lipid II flippase FtsW [Candidatus Saccharibacteria bacterium]|nr:putative lipid II flippase FtsW [Candidatus Saccharibacteria bacterium]